ncbi:MAG: hypothetical protein EVA90_05255, partial [SAR116 cluster bacterium]
MQHRPIQNWLFASGICIGGRASLGLTGTAAVTGDVIMRDAVIVSTARTPIGKAYRGAFNDTQAQA